jgi:outer membrane protein assembly factor BamB/tetratricopeptide (TPR) repeat protein
MKQRRIAVVLCWFLLVFLLARIPNATAQPQPAAADEESNSPFNLAPRPLRRLFELAQEELAEKRYSESVRRLGQILDDVETPEDFFFQLKSDDARVRSLKGEAQRLLGEMPSEGREAYELEYGARARKMLEGAVAGGDVAGLAAVSRQFFHTRAGYEATYLLGTAEMEQGHSFAAALCLRRLRDAPTAAELGSKVLLKLAVCWARAGMTDEALAALAKLTQLYPKTELIVAGRTTKPPANSAQAAAWLEQALGSKVRPAHAGPEPFSDYGPKQWSMYRGSSSRNAASVGSTPLLNRRWAVPNANDPHVERLLTAKREAFLEEGGRVLPGLHPLAVKGFVFMRTVSGLEAVDFRTGKRIWYAPVERSVEELLDTAASGPAAAPAPTANLLVNWIDQRVWDDAIYGTLASDGELVYAVEDLDIQPPLAQMIAGGFQRQRMIINNGGPASMARPYNRLAAYEIATEGKLKWSVGGQTGDGQLPLAGAFFLGPPLPLAGKLYVLAELKGEIRLFALDPKNEGRLEWSQQLAAALPAVQEDPLRRFAGATPSYADGILVCPTSAGAAVAIDLATRSLLWGFQYPRAIDPVFQNRMMRMQGLPGDDAGDNDHWADASVTIAVGRVLLTPVESRQLHCLNLVDGTPLWGVPRDDGMYVACVNDDQVLVVGRRGLRSYDLADGTSAWHEATLNLPEGSAPSGRGFFDGKRYYLPLTSAEVAAVDLAAGRIVARSKSRSGIVPGNLICYQGAVISQGVEALESFHQLEDLRRQVAATLSERPDDADALARQGELLLDEGRLEESVSHLRRSFEIKPDARTRELLIDALLEGLRLDFAAHRRHLDEIEQLADSPAARTAYLRLLATGLQQSGEIEAAFRAYLRLVDLGPPGEELEKLDGGLSVRRDRWVRARLAGLREAALQNAAKQRTAANPGNTAQPNELARLDAALQARFEAAKASPGPAALREFLDYFGGHPLADAAREQLAIRLIDKDACLEAERLLRELERSSIAERARAAAARMARLLAHAGRDDDAAGYYRRLAGEWADVVCLDGMTGRELVEELPADVALRPLISGERLWPVGQVHEQKQPGTPQPKMSFPVEVRGRVAPFIGHMTIESDQNPNQAALVGRDGLGRERWRVSLRDRNEIAGNMFQASQARLDGHLLLVSNGFQLLAIDTLGVPGTSTAHLLWSKDLGEVSNVVNMGMQNIQIQIGVRRQMNWGGLVRGTPSSAGPAFSGCVVFQRRRNLAAVDPLTGEMLWVRRDLPAGCELFGDAERLFVVPPNAAEAVVLRAIDGEELGRRAVPRSDSGGLRGDDRLTAFGPLVLVWAQSDMAGKSTLRLFDPWEQTDVWQHAFDSESFKTLADDDAVGVLEKSGHFVLLSLADGKVEIDAQLDPETGLNEIHLLRGETTDLLVTSRPAGRRNMPFQAPGLMATSFINGNLHGFDRATGTKVFTRAIENKLLSMNQPAELPVLLFASPPQRQVPGSPQQGNLLCVDKRNGRIVFEENMQPLPGSIEIEGDPVRHEVLLRAPGSSFKLAFTAEPYTEEPSQPKR